MITSTNTTNATIDFLRGLFESNDYLCITAIHSTEVWTDQRGQERSSTKDYFGTLEDAEESLPVLEKLNQDGWNLYACMAPLKPGVQSREADNIALIRHCFIEIDENGPEGLALVREAVAAGEVPAPSVINESSPGKFHIIWNCEADGLTPAQVKVLNQALVKKFGADKAAVDANRILRLPGFVNHSFPNKPGKASYDGFVVRTLEGDFTIYEPSQFHIDVQSAYEEDAEVEGIPIEFDAAKIQSLLAGDAQAACRCNSLASKHTPFFQIVNVIAAIFRARVRRAIAGLLPLARSPA